MVQKGQEDGGGWGSVMLEGWEVQGMMGERIGEGRGGVGEFFFGGFVMM